MKGRVVSSQILYSILWVQLILFPHPKPHCFIDPFFFPFSSLLHRPLPAIFSPLLFASLFCPSSLLYCHLLSTLPPPSCIVLISHCPSSLLYGSLPSFVLPQTSIVLLPTPIPLLPLLSSFLSLVSLPLLPLFPVSYCHPSPIVPLPSLT